MAAWAARLILLRHDGEKFLAAKLFFYYSAMNAGKSTTLLQSSYNYNEKGMKTLLFVPGVDTRYGSRKITSRIGLEAEAYEFNEGFNFQAFIQSQVKKDPEYKCVLVDEAQFLSKEQVLQLSAITITLDIPVLCYGIRTDFQGEPFPGSLYLLAWADQLVELKTICHCGRKATMNMRIDEFGRPEKKGEQIEIGGNDRYTAVCRQHFSENDPGIISKVH